MADLNNARTSERRLCSLSEPIPPEKRVISRPKLIEPPPKSKTPRRRLKSSNAFGKKIHETAFAITRYMRTFKLSKWANMVRTDGDFEGLVRAVESRLYFSATGKIKVYPFDELVEDFAPDAYHYAPTPSKRLINLGGYEHKTAQNIEKLFNDIPFWPVLYRPLKDAVTVSDDFQPLITNPRHLNDEWAKKCSKYLKSVDYEEDAIADIIQLLRDEKEKINRNVKIVMEKEALRNINFDRYRDCLDEITERYNGSKYMSIDMFSLNAESKDRRGIYDWASSQLDFLSHLAEISGKEETFSVEELSMDDLKATPGAAMQKIQELQNELTRLLKCIDNKYGRVSMEEDQQMLLSKSNSLFAKYNTAIYEYIRSTNISSVNIFWFKAAHMQFHACFYEDGRVRRARIILRDATWYENFLKEIKARCEESCKRNKALGGVVLWLETEYELVSRRSKIAEKAFTSITKNYRKKCNPLLKMKEHIEQSVFASKEWAQQEMDWLLKMIDSSNGHTGLEKVTPQIKKNSLSLEIFEDIAPKVSREQYDKYVPFIIEGHKRIEEFFHNPSDICRSAFLNDKFNDDALKYETLLKEFDDEICPLLKENLSEYSKVKDWIKTEQAILKKYFDKCDRVIAGISSKYLGKYLTLLRCGAVPNPRYIPISETVHKKPPVRQYKTIGGIACFKEIF